LLTNLSSSNFDWEIFVWQESFFVFGGVFGFELADFGFG
jgi:hypothetical protein